MSIEKVPFAVVFRAFLKETGYTIPQVALHTGIDKSKLYTWARKNKPSEPSNPLEKELLLAFFKTVREFLDRKSWEKPNYVLQEPDLTNKGNNNPEKTDSGLIGFTINGETISFPDKNTEWGKLSIMNGTQVIVAAHPSNPAAFSKIDGWTAEGLIEMWDNSMEPIIKKGAILAIRRVHILEGVKVGAYYLVIDIYGNKCIRRADWAPHGSIRFLPESLDNYSVIELKRDEMLTIFRIGKTLDDL